MPCNKCTSLDKDTQQSCDALPSFEPASLSLFLSLAQKERKRKNANAFVCTPSERFIIGTLFPFYPLLLLPFLPFTLSPFSWKKCLTINLISPPAARVAAAWRNPYPGRQDRQHKLTGRSCLSKFPLLRVFSTGRRETEETGRGEEEIGGKETGRRRRNNVERI